MEWLIVFVAVGLFLLVRNRRKARRAEPARVGRATPAPSPPRIANPRRGGRKPPAKWIAPGETIVVGGVSISGGMIYVGGDLPSQHGTPENCLIDPALPVAKRNPDHAGQTMGYWPSYARIDPRARRAYLDWLADGRRDPNAYIGYVFLFFYGLERRVLLDGGQSDTPAIVAEVERLLDIYGENHSFRGYAGRFLDAVGVMRPDRMPEPAPSLDLRGYGEMALGIRVRLGRRLAASTPLDADDALTWVVAHPETNLRTPATRCFDLLVALWRIRFVEKYPRGLAVKAPRKRLETRYRAASGTFEVPVPITVHGRPLPDIAALGAPLAPLGDLLEACTRELEPYSRLIGRRPDAKGTIEAALSLPEPLRESVGADALVGAKDGIARLMNGARVTATTPTALFAALGVPLPETAKLPAGTASLLGTLLDGMNLAFEPDRRYGGDAIRRDGRMVLFAATAGAPVDPGKPAYKVAKTMIEVAALVASTDGPAGADDFDAMRSELGAVPGLTSSERTRLLAVGTLLVDDAPRKAALLRKLKETPPAGRAQVARAALAAVLADGRVSPGEVKFLEQLYKALDLPTDDVYAALHRGTVSVDDPIVVAAPERGRGGVAIPPPPRAEPAPAAATVDTARLERLRRETSAVASLLADVFAEEDAVIPEIASADTEASAFDGLDGAHGALLARLLVVGDMDRAAFESEVRARRLLPDGAIETINEWSFEIFDEPALGDEGDRVVLAAHLAPDLTARMKETA